MKRELALVPFPGTLLGWFDAASEGLIWLRDIATLSPG